MTEPTVRYEVVHDDEFDVWDVYVHQLDGTTAHGGFDSITHALAYVERLKRYGRWK